MNELPRRKIIRLRGFDYSANGAYFITICVKNKANLLWNETKAVPTISNIINQFKGSISKQVGFSLWQSRFYDHIISDDENYEIKWNYIDGNPSKWLEDEYYSKS